MAIPKGEEGFQNTGKHVVLITRPLRGRCSLKNSATTSRGGCKNIECPNFTTVYPVTCHMNLALEKVFSVISDRIFPRPFISKKGIRFSVEKLKMSAPKKKVGKGWGIS